MTRTVPTTVRSRQSRLENFARRVDRQCISNPALAKDNIVLHHTNYSRQSPAKSDIL